MMDWDYIRKKLTLLKEWTKRMNRDVRVRSALSVYTYARSYEEFLEDIKRTLEAIAPSEVLVLKDKEYPAVRLLSDGEVEALWDEFSKVLKDADIKPEEHRAAFERLLVRQMPYEENRLILLDEARLIVLAKKYPQLSRKGWGALQEALKRAVKAVDWESLGRLMESIAYLILLLEDSAKIETPRSAYKLTLDLKGLVRSIITHIEMIVPGVAEVLKAAGGNSSTEVAETYKEGK